MCLLVQSEELRFTAGTDKARSCVHGDHGGWITLGKQVCAKIVLVQTDHIKYCQTCRGPSLGSSRFEGKQWTHTQVIVTHGVIRVIVASRLLILFYSVCRVDFLVSLFENVMIMFHWCQCSFSVFALMQRVFMRIMILRSSQ